MSVTDVASGMLHLLASRPDVNLSEREESRSKGPSVGRLNSPSP